MPFKRVEKSFERWPIIKCATHLTLRFTGGRSPASRPVKSLMAFQSFQRFNLVRFDK